VDGRSICITLKPGGSLVLVDFHPVLWILDEEFKEIKYPYFNTGVIIEDTAGSYAAPEADHHGKLYLEPQYQ
jgi:hypothetical protein